MVNLARFQIVFCSLLVLGCLIPTSAQEATPTVIPEPCIAIIGDSIAQGGVVVEVPGSGFPVIQTTPFSAVLTENLTSMESEYSVADYSVGGIGLGDNAYVESEAYAQLLATVCEIGIIFPWVNDLPQDTGADAVRSAIEQHTENLTELISTLISETAIKQVLLLNYYYIPETEMGTLVYETATAPHIITQMNNYLDLLCADWVAVDAPILCLDLATFFAFEADTILVEISTDEFNTNGYTALNPEQNAYFGNFWAQFPDQALRTDGTHLNLNGKQLLTGFVIETLFPAP